MERQLISLKEIEALQKKRFFLWVFAALSFLVLFGFVVLAFSLQNRSTQRLWIILGTVVTSLWLIVMAYLFLKMMLPLNKYLSFSRKALSHERSVAKVKITGICRDIESYDGFKTRCVEGVEVDEKSKLHFRYEGTSDLDLKVGSVYEIESYDDLIVRIKESV